MHSAIVLYASSIPFIVPWCSESNRSNFQREVQEHELTVIRDFESRILSLQDEDSAKRLTASTAQSESLARLSRSFRQFMRSIGGEGPSSDDSPKTDDLESWSAASSSAEWALERDCELARLEKENDELRRMISADVRDSRAQKSNASEPARPPTTVPSHDNRTLGGGLARAGSAGSYGTLNDMRLIG